MNDSFYHFFDDFSKSKLTHALQHIIKGPETPYDALISQDRTLFFLENFVDAAVFQKPYDFLQALDLLIEVVTENDAKRLLKAEETAMILHGQSRSANKMISTHPRLAGMLKGWKRFQKAKPDLAASIGITFPSYPFRFAMAPSPIFLSDAGAIPLIHLEPCTGNFCSFLDRYKTKPALFTFETKVCFAQMLQYPEVVESLCMPNHFVYIMELYPEIQLALQKSLPKGSFQPVVFAKRALLSKGLVLFENALHTNQDLLYNICKRTLYCIQEERLGIQRACALFEKTTALNWNDPHKGLPPKEAPLGPEPKDYLGIRYSQLAKERAPRKVQDKKKLLVAHIVSQLVDDGHAPTNLLKAMIDHRDKEKFDLVVISTERLTFHPAEYPYNFFCSERSELRAGELIERWKEEGVSVYIAPESLTYEATARYISSLLHDLQVDVALFHGPDIINTSCAQITDVPLRVLFEHGWQPTHPGFDILIASSDQAATIYQELYKKLDITPYTLAFSSDPRASWQEPAPTKSDLGIPEEAFVLTTISNHLESRLGPEMCQAIAEILKRQPKAFYAPIGKVLDEKSFVEYFKKQGVHDRVLFLGERQNPSQYARAMQLYLNEFPFGSGLGILDAMASGCPVVSMYDAEGPQQARYGGIYMGLDRVITTCNREDYVALACRLISDSSLYQKWKKASLVQYEKRTDIKGYVQKIEQIITHSLIT